MAVKTFCDRCGKEIKPRTLFHPLYKCEYDTFFDSNLSIRGLRRKKYTLCFDCTNALRIFLKDYTEIEGEKHVLY